MLRRTLLHAYLPHAIRRAVWLLRQYKPADLFGVTAHMRLTVPYFRSPPTDARKTPAAGYRLQASLSRFLDSGVGCPAVTAIFTDAIVFSPPPVFCANAKTLHLHASPTCRYNQPVTTSGLPLPVSACCTHHTTIAQRLLWRLARCSLPFHYAWIQTPPRYAICLFSIDASVGRLARFVCVPSTCCLVLLPSLIF